jgi:hypothetical protein
MVALLFGVPIQANATTYDYVGQPFTTFSGLCTASLCTALTGSVTFNFETSEFTGTVSLSPGDTASVYIGIPSALYAPDIASTISYPSYTVYYYGSTTFGYSSGLNGNFALVDGEITGWSLSGGAGKFWLRWSWLL